MSAGECQTRNANDYSDDEKEDTPPPLDAEDIELLKAYGVGPYTKLIKDAEGEIKTHQETVKTLIGIKESDTGLSQPSQWDLVGDKQMMQEEQVREVKQARACNTHDSNSSNVDAAPASGQVHENYRGR